MVLVIGSFIIRLILFCKVVSVWDYLFKMVGFLCWVKFFDMMVIIMFVLVRCLVWVRW